MIIKSVTPINYGPFYHSATLELEDDVTVITGPNDAGKSSLLRLIGMCCGVNLKTFSEYDANFDRNQEFTGSWEDGKMVACEVVCKPTDRTPLHLSGHLPEGSTFTLRHAFSAKGMRIERIILTRSDGSGVGINSEWLRQSPHLVYLPTQDLVREEINLQQQNPVEQALLKIAFGPAFSFDQKLSNASAMMAAREFKRAEERLNAALKRLLPPSLHLEFMVSQVESVRHRMGLSVVDRHDGHTPLSVRGRGIQTIVTLIGMLLGLNNQEGHVVILYDEPENSLHPDSQHALRRILEELAVQPHIQVVYSTHSPAMINTWRGRSVRLLQRKMVDERATTIIHNSPIEGNYQRIRTSLGITPADSLLYAPVILLVEGVTEALCLPQVYRKLEEAKTPGFERASILLSQTHLMDGNGDTFKKMCRLAASQGAKPVIFLDGDKEKAAREVRGDFPDVPTILLPPGTEFEQIVPEEVYFAALREELGEEGITSDKFHLWIQANPQGVTVFTKQVNHWLFKEYGSSLERKAEVMRRAVELVPAERIQTKELLNLLKAVEQRLQEV